MALRKQMEALRAAKKVQKEWQLLNKDQDDKKELGPSSQQEAEDKKEEKKGKKFMKNQKELKEAQKKEREESAAASSRGRSQEVKEVVLQPKDKEKGAQR
jgi:hypothetical protein